MEKIQIQDDVIVWIDIIILRCLKSWFKIYVRVILIMKSFEKPILEILLFIIFCLILIKISLLYFYKNNLFF